MVMLLWVKIEDMVLKIGDLSNITAGTVFQNILRMRLLIQPLPSKKILHINKKIFFKNLILKQVKTRI